MIADGPPFLCPGCLGTNIRLCRVYYYADGYWVPPPCEGVVARCMNCGARTMLHVVTRRMYRAGRPAPTPKMPHMGDDG